MSKFDITPSCTMVPSALLFIITLVTPAVLLEAISVFAFDKIIKGLRPVDPEKYTALNLAIATPV